jgi:cobalamin synthase
MGFLDFLTVGNFKKSLKGHWHFFPYGIFGQGYVIDSERSYKKLRRQMTICLLVSLLLGLLILKISRMGNLIYLLLLIPLLFGQHFLIYRLYRHMTPTDEKLTFRDLFNNRFVLWSYLISTITMAAIFLCFLFYFPTKWMIAVPGFVIFAFLAGFLIKLIIGRKSPHTKDSSIS